MGPLIVFSSEMPLYSSTRYIHEEEKQKKKTKLGRKFEMNRLVLME